MTGDLFIEADWRELQGPVRFASARVSVVRGREVTSVSLDPEWIRRYPGILIDPALMEVEGPQYATDAEGFGFLRDSAPDRWGRLLMRRREAIEAREEGRAERTLLPLDYLLGVADRGRMGGLRFRTDAEGPFLDDRAVQAIPPTTRLRSLESASRRFEDSEVGADPGSDFQQLLAPGSSLGGARPKASVIDAEGYLWIAKFPSKLDDTDVGAWERVAQILAADAGILTTDSRIERFSKAGHTFLIRRFDRTGEERHHFASAMCLLGCHDGDDARTGFGYLDLADLITRISVRPQEDLEELWRRVVFSILISNTDDHLRNHGFLWSGRGWRLSPLYDVNPQPEGSSLSLLITDNDNSLHLAPARQLADLLRIPIAKQNHILNTCHAAVRRWSDTARALGISKAACSHMKSAFERH